MRQRVLSRLGMLVTSDPVAELDDDLRRLRADLADCREHAMAERLTALIDQRLDERCAFLTGQPSDQNRGTGAERDGASRG